jgi:DNA-binding transcriptional ArsR family regulator
LSWADAKSFEKDDLEVSQRTWHLTDSMTTICEFLADGRYSASIKEIVAAVPVGQSTVSEHLRQLAAVGFVLAEDKPGFRS